MNNIFYQLISNFQAHCNLKSLVLIAAYLSFATSGFSQELLPNNMSDNQIFKLSLTDSYRLSEPLYNLGSLKIAALQDKDRLVVFGDVEAGILLYTNRGKQQKKIGNSGRGPFEYVDLGAINITQSKNIVVWDDAQLKLISYSKDGENLMEINKFRWAVSKMTTPDNEVYFYNSGNSTNKKYIERYDLSENKYKEAYGIRSQTDVLLEINEESGGLAYKGDYVYSMTPGALVVNRINRVTQKEELFSVEDEEFIVPDIKDAAQVIGGNSRELLNTVEKSSYVRNLFALDNYLVVYAQNGEGKYLKEYNAYSLEGREIRFYVIDYDSMKLIDTFTFSIAANRKIQDHLWIPSTDGLVYISTYDIESEEQKVNADAPYKVHFFNISKSDK